jgi:flagellar hook-length control protein FliK
MSTPALLHLLTGLGAGLNGGGAGGASPRDTMPGQFARQLQQAQLPGQQIVVTPAPPAPTPSAAPSPAPAPAAAQASPAAPAPAPVPAPAPAPAPPPAPARSAAAPPAQRPIEARNASRSDPSAPTEPDAKTVDDEVLDTETTDAATAERPGVQGQRGPRSALERWLLTGKRPEGSGPALPTDAVDPVLTGEAIAALATSPGRDASPVDIAADARLQALAAPTPDDAAETATPVLALALAAPHTPAASARHATAAALEPDIGSEHATGIATAIQTAILTDGGPQAAGDPASASQLAAAAQAGDGRVDARASSAAGLQSTAAIATAIGAQQGQTDAGATGHEAPGGSAPGDAAPAAAQTGVLPTALPGFAAELARAGSTGMSHGAAPSTPAEVHLRTPVHSPEFTPRLGAEVALLARDGVQEARVHVNPVHLGPISVQITLDGTAAQVHLAVDNAQTRELLEQAMPGLAAALRESGLTLTGGGVFQQARQQGREAPAGGRPSNGRAADAGDAVDLAASTPSRRVRLPGALDVYA